MISLQTLILLTRNLQKMFFQKLKNAKIKKRKNGIRNKAK